MREIEKIDFEIEHIEYVQSMLTNKLSALKKERDEPRKDAFIKNRLTKQLAKFFKSHGFFIVSLNNEKERRNNTSLPSMFGDQKMS